MATSGELQESISWDTDLLVVEPGEHGSDAALDVLDDLDDDSSVESVRAYAGADGGPSRIGTKHLLRVLQLAEGGLALVTWTSMGIKSIGYRPGDQRFDIANHSGIDKLMGRDPDSYDQATRKEAKDELAWCEPAVVCRSECNLLPALDDVEVIA